VPCESRSAARSTPLLGCAAPMTQPVESAEDRPTDGDQEQAQAREEFCLTNSIVRLSRAKPYLDGGVAPTCPLCRRRVKRKGESVAEKPKSDEGSNNENCWLQDRRHVAATGLILLDTEAHAGAHPLPASPPDHPARVRPTNQGRSG
jgi:hypothetical protein